MSWQNGNNGPRGPQGVNPADELEQLVQLGQDKLKQAFGGGSRKMMVIMMSA